MNTSLQGILEAALRLPHADRVELIDALAASLGPDEAAAVDAAWAEEIERRVREYEEGKLKAIPWSEVQERVRKKYGDHA
jgi:putative addiction module component (TIGR02574 family)